MIGKEQEQKLRDLQFAANDVLDPHGWDVLNQRGHTAFVFTVGPQVPLDKDMIVMGMRYECARCGAWVVTKKTPDESNYGGLAFELDCKPNTVFPHLVNAEALFMVGDDKPSKKEWRKAKRGAERYVRRTRKLLEKKSLDLEAPL